MDPTDDRANSVGNVPTESSRPIRLGGAVVGPRRHICAFFNSHDDEYRVLLPFVKDGLESGERAVHTVDPQRLDEHLQRLAVAGIDGSATRPRRQLELRTWTDTHLRDGYFDQHKTLPLFEAVVKDSKEQGFSAHSFCHSCQMGFGECVRGR